MLSIPSWSWTLFGWDGTTTMPAFDANAEAVATIVSEQETVETLKCKVVR